MNNQLFKPIKEIHFSILNNDDIRAMSALADATRGIEFPELHDKSEPKFSGLIDPRMDGPGIIYETCQLNNKFIINKKYNKKKLRKIKRLKMKSKYNEYSFSDLSFN